MIEPQCEGGTDRCGDLNYRTLSPDCSRQVIVLLGGRRELAQHVALADSCQLLPHAEYRLPGVGDDTSLPWGEPQWCHRTRYVTQDRTT